MDMEKAIYAMVYFLAVIITQGLYNERKKKLGAQFDTTTIKSIHFWLGVVQMLLLLGGSYYALSVWAKDSWKGVIEAMAIYPALWFSAKLYADGGSIVRFIIGLYLKDSKIILQETSNIKENGEQVEKEKVQTESDSAGQEG